MTYTPTTEEMRERYVRWNRMGGSSGEEYEAEFDRWLNAERACVWDEVIHAMKYEDGTPVELVANINPYRSTT